MGSILARRKPPSKESIGIIVGEHPLEEAAFDVGVKLVEGLKGDGLPVQVFEVPRSLTYLEVIPEVVRRFNEGVISERCLKANLSYNNPSRDAIQFMMGLKRDHPGTLFYSMHNFVARYDGRRSPPDVGFGSEATYGWRRLDELGVELYPRGEFHGSKIQEMEATLFSGGSVSRKEWDRIATCHIGVTEGDEYKFQEGPREKLKPKKLSRIPVHHSNVHVVELPGLITHFLGESSQRKKVEIETGFRHQGQLWGNPDECEKAVGLRREIKDRETGEMLLARYLFNWSVFDREVNGRAGLTGEHVVNPIREFIKQDFRDAGRRRV